MATSKQGARREMTPAWKRLVLSTLADNKDHKRRPATLAELGRIVGADKRGMYNTFHTDQPTSKYVDAICKILKIDPPLREAPLTDDEKLRALAPDRQAALLTFANGISDAIRNLPPDQQKPIRALIANFLRDFLSG